MSAIWKPDPGFWSKTAWIQLGYGIWVSMTMVGIGLAMGFPAVTIPQLNSANSSIKITTSDESWIASVLTLVSPAGCLVCGYLMDKFGRKIILIMCEIPMFVGWIYTGFASSAKDIIVGRIITGFGIGMAMGAPRIYITEISLPNMRGTVGALPNLAVSIGLSLLAGCGAYLHWKTICYMCGAYSLILFVFNFLLPETPYFVLLKGTQANALASLRKFRSKTYQTDKEIDDLMEYKAVNNIRRLSFKDEMLLLCTKAACKPFCIVFAYLFISQISGVTIIFMWAVELIEASSSSVDANLGNFLMGITRLVCGVLSSCLLYKIGRRPQALVSSMGVGLMFITLSGVLYSKTPPTVFPVICFLSVVMFATIGYYTIPLLITYELFPLQIRGLLGGITVAILNFLIFGVSKLYPYFRNLIGHANIITCFGLSSLLGTIYLYFYLPETKGLTLQEIEEYFNDLRPTLVSQRSVIAAQLSGSNRVITSATKQNKSDTQTNKNVLQLKKKKKDKGQPPPSNRSSSDDNK